MNENCRPAARRDPQANECGGCEALELELRKRIEDVCVNRIDVQSPVDGFDDLSGLNEAVRYAESVRRFNSSRHKEAIEAAESVRPTKLASGWTCTRADQEA